MTLLDLNRLAESLSAPQFEQLLRLRLQRALDGLPEGHSIMLLAMKKYGSSQLGSCSWKIGDVTRDQTSGEILDDCVAEHRRRLDFNKNNKLMLIEATASAVEILPLDDEIPS